MAAAGTHLTFELRPGFLEEVARQQRERVVQAHAAHPVARAPSSLASQMAWHRRLIAAMPVAQGLRTSAMLSGNLVLPACLLQRVAQRQEHFGGWEATARGLILHVLHRVGHLLGRERRERVHCRAVVQAELRE